MFQLPLVSQFKSKMEKVYKEKVGEFMDVMGEKVKNKFSISEYNMFKTEYFGLIFLAINFCIFALHSYTKYFSSDISSDLVPVKEFAKVVTTETTEYFY